MAATAFYRTANNFSTTTPGYTAGSGSLVLAAGQGAALESQTGVLSATNPVAISTFSADGATPYGVYKATGRSTDTLTGLTLLSGADTTLPAGSVVSLRWTKQHADQMATAINATALPNNWFNIRDYGAVPGSAGAAATRAAFQAIVDLALARPGTKPRYTIYVPADPANWFLDTSVFIDDGKISVVGDGPEDSIIATGLGNEASMFMVGVRRGPAATTDHWFDLFGKLDTTAAPAPAPAANARYGLRAKGVGDGKYSVYSHGAGPWSNGLNDNYTTLRALTVEFALDQAQAPLVTNPLFGMARKGKILDPWIVNVNGTKMVFQFRLTDGATLEGGNNYQFDITPPSSAGVHRYCFQVDIANGVGTAFVDGLQVATSAITTSTGGPTFAAGANYFAPQRQSPFKIAASGASAAFIGSEYETSPGNITNDIALCGLRLSGVLRYGNDGVGLPQRRLVGGGVPTDLQAYFTYDINVIAHIFMTDTPAAASVSRKIKVQGNNGLSYMLITDDTHNTNNASIGGVEFRNLGMIQQNAETGGCITIFGALETTVENCILRGGGHGFGAWNWYANYTTRIRDCTLFGWDAAYYNFFGIALLNNITVPNNARNNFWCDGSARLILDGVFANPGQVPETLLRASGGSLVDVYNYVADIEVLNGTPKYCGFYAATVNAGGSVWWGRLLLDNCNVALFAPGTPIVDLYESSPTDLPGQFRISDLQCSARNVDSLVRVRGSGRVWIGEVEADLSPFVTPLRNVGGCAGINTIHRTYVAPPNRAEWMSGAHELLVPTPLDGQFTRWRCAIGGKHGTVKMPAWVGDTPLDAGVNGLACYMAGAVYWVAGAGSTAGYYASVPMTRVVNTLFTGSAATPPAFAKIGLAVGPGNEQATVVEFTVATGPSTVTTPGYVRLSTATTDWAAAASGVMSNINPFTFAPATGDWVPARAIVLYGTGNEVVAIVDMGAGTPTLSGASYTIAAGAIAVAPSAPTGLPAAFWNQIHNHFFRNMALTAPTLYVALSTALADPTVAPAEPVGSGYARVSAPAASWKSTPAAATFLAGTAVNLLALTFPTPTGSWGTVKSAYLMDASTGGIVVACGNLTIPRTPAAAPAPSFAVGTLCVAAS